MAGERPTVAPVRVDTGRGLPTVRPAYCVEWDRAFGAGALIFGLLLLLGDLQVSLVAPLIGAGFLFSGSYCAVRHGRQVGLAALGIGLVLLVPLMGLDVLTLTAYKILVGGALGVYGIFKLT